MLGMTILILYLFVFHLHRVGIKLKNEAPQARSILILVPNMDQVSNHKR